MAGWLAGRLVCPSSRPTAQHSSGTLHACTLPMCPLSACTPQGAVRRRDLVPGLKEAGWRSSWCMLLMEPYQVGVGAYRHPYRCPFPHPHPHPVTLSLNPNPDLQHTVHWPASLSACILLVACSAVHPSITLQLDTTESQRAPPLSPAHPPTHPSFQVTAVSSRVVAILYGFLATGL